MFAQIVVINELDCDTPGVDDKEFVELKSVTPNFSLDGFILVFLMVPLRAEIEVISP